MYQFKEELNIKNFFKFQKSIVESKLWADLPLATKSIYPVIACHANSKGIAFPSQKTIGILSGCDTKTVRQGIKGLYKISNVTVKDEVNKRGRRTKKYFFNIPENNKNMFAFYKAVIDSGIWKVLREDFKTQSAHAVYCMLMTYSFFEIDWYSTIENNDEYYDDLEYFYSDIFPYRKYDFISPELGVVAEYSGIGIKTVLKAFDALEEVQLLKNVSDIVEGNNYPVWQIFRIPPVYYKRNYLN